MARKTPLRTPIGRGDYLHKDQSKEHFELCVDLVYCFIVCLFLALYNIFHTSMAQCSLFLYAESAIKHAPANQPVT